MSRHNKLEHFPINIFPVVMGLTGWTLAWHKAQHVLNLDWPVGHILTGLSIVVFAVLATLYLVKLVRHPDAVAAELKHPIKLSFFPAVSISLILLGAAMAGIEPYSAKVFWWSGVVLQLFLLLFVINSWINHEHFETIHMNPSWFIPAVGNVLVPVAGVQFGYVEISWFFFSVGIVFWIVLLTIVFNRILFHNPLPPNLLPTLAILIAPPAVGFVGYVKLAGGLNDFGRILFGSALFFTFFVATQMPRFMKLQFSLAWWAYSFPLAGITIATWVMFEETKEIGYLYLAQALLAALSAIMFLLMLKTVKAVINKQICLPE